MWLAAEVSAVNAVNEVNTEPRSVFFELSPKVFQTENGFILVDLAPTWSYWQVKGGVARA